jgi:putative acetyltransferase
VSDPKILIDLVFAMFHDGSIAEGNIREDGTCELKIDIEYLAERVDPKYRAFRVELAGFSDFVFEPWLEGEPAPAIDFETAAGLDLTILSAEIDATGLVSLHCTQDYHDTGYDGGVIQFRASGLQLFDESGKAMTVAELETISDGYWEEFGHTAENLLVRSSEAGDADAIGRVLEQAFAPSVYEKRLREQIAAGDYGHAEWVAELDGEVVAHIIYTPATKDGNNIGYHVGPLAVLPEMHHRGIGSQLIEETLKLPPVGGSSVFVLGDPAYYERFGFEPTATACCPFVENNRNFRALRWQEAGEPFEIGYAKAFTDAAE